MNPQTLQMDTGIRDMQAELEECKARIAGDGVRDISSFIDLGERASSYN